MNIPCQSVSLSEHCTMISLLPTLLILVGVRPCFQSRDPSGSIQNRMSFVGVFFIVLHPILSIYCDYKSEEEMAELPEVYDERNNIMYGTLVLGRVISMLMQPALVIGACCQVKAFRELLTLVESLDEYLFVMGVKTKKVMRRMVILDRLVFLSMILMTILNYAITYYFFVIYYGLLANPHDMYTSLSVICVFVVSTSTTATYIYGVSIRMDAYIRVLRKILI